MSPQRRAEQTEYNRAKQQAYDRDRGQCQAAPLILHIECAGRLDPHHTAGRATRQERNNPDLLLTTCRAHHDWIHAHPDMSRTLGLHQ